VDLSDVIAVQARVGVEQDLVAELLDEVE